MRMPVAFVAAVVALAFPALSSPATATLIAYSDSNGNLYVSNDQGTGARTLYETDGTTTMRALDVSPDGTQVLAVDDGDTVQLVLIPVAGGTPVPIPGADGSDAGAFSPNGSHVVFSVNEYSSSPLAAGIYTVSVSGGTPQLVVASPSGDFDSLPTYSPDGAKIAFTRDVFDSKGNESVTLELVAASGGSPETLTAGLIADVSTGGKLAFSPDGTRIAFAGEDTKPGIFTVPVAGGASTRLTTDFDFWPAFSADGSKIFFARDAGSANADDNAARPVASTGDDLSELWTVKKDGASEAVVAEGDFQTIALGAGSAAAAATGTSPSTPTATTTSSGAPATTSTTTPGARPAKAAAASSISVRRRGVRYLVTWRGTAPAWRVVLKVGHKTASAIVKGSLHAHTFVLPGARGAVSARVLIR
jgi:Tol biopolymer transport system component